MVLRHRDRELLRFEWVEPHGVRVVSVNFPGVLTKKMKDRLDGLRGFRIKRHSRYNLPARRIEAIEDFTQKRIREICEYGDKADDLLKIEAISDSVNHVTEGSLGKCASKGAETWKPNH